MKNGGGGKSSPAKQITTQTTNQRMKMKYPRTMNEAFPHTVEYGASIEIHVAHISTADKIIRVLALVALIVLCLDIFIWRP
jgi:hypothetical protein